MDHHSCVQTPGTERSNTGSECTTIYQDLHTSTHPTQSWTIRIKSMHAIYRFAYGDIVCYPLAEKERRWKFDTKNEMEFYLVD